MLKKFDCHAIFVRDLHPYRAVIITNICFEFIRGIASCKTFIYEYILTFGVV